MTDLNALTAPAWTAAFSYETNMNGWRAAGLVPFTRGPMWDMLAQEKRKVPPRPP